MGYTQNADGSLVINPTPKTVEDLQAIADLAMRVGGVLKVTSGERTSLAASQTRVGWLISETDTGRLYLRTAEAPQGVLIRSDTGWVTPDLVAGWTVQDPDVFGYRVVNGALHFRGRLRATAAAVQSILAVPLPVEARPQQEYNARVFVTSGTTASFVVSVTTGGQVIIYKGTGVVNDLPLNAIGGIPLG